MTTGSAFTFACPECGESLPVNTAMWDALVENGCVVCSASVPSTAISETGSDRQSVYVAPRGAHDRTDKY